MSKIVLTKTEKATYEVFKDGYDFFYCKTHGLFGSYYANDNSTCKSCGKQCEPYVAETDHEIVDKLCQTTTFHVIDKNNLLNVQREITTFEVIENGVNVGYAKLTKTKDILLLSFDVPQSILRGKRFEGLSSTDFKIHLMPV